MVGSTSRETHFRYITIYLLLLGCNFANLQSLILIATRVNIVAEAFKSKMQPARHRMVYTLLKDEMAAEGGIHALQLKTRTPEEEEKTKAKESS